MKKSIFSKDERLSEKAFSQSLLVSVVSILLCIVALCSATYAWFTEDTASGNNTLTSGCFDIASVSVVPSDAVALHEGEAQTIEVVRTDDVFHCTLPAAGEYTVTLTLDGESTAKGHCVVTVGGETLTTDAIIGSTTANKDGYTENSPFTFILETTEPDTAVTFTPVWGVVTNPDLPAIPTTE